ncbi:NifB/NifX family molybdenum-iron cluster-binding protein [Natranaerobius trueperi]|uniref:Dinitrogenase iron-molybdenum cofactor n=1 Tax=Natranaerobius trueperi TaxID=759412 RepID=A0A226BY46_9FIRM|nr:NifB/NifX family molybdenum-iron cluster-binding protein [Natranaerobius trueperi]OWZ83851.1 dinitrogenase iron-molybdenum cofactor [Natranaerobius trueperi]
MKIAISTDKGQVASHFGRCPEFTIVEIKNGEVVSKEAISNPGHQPGFLPKFLSEKGVQCIIAGGMGERAKRIFDDNGVGTIVGIEGEVDSVIKKYNEGKLSGNESYCQH